MVSTKSALEADDSSKDLVLSRSQLSKALVFEGLRHTLVQQCFIHLGLQHSSFQAMRGGRIIINLRAEPLEACPDEAE